MQILKPKFEILTPQSRIDDINKMIEVVGRTCYRSEDRITDDSATRFVKMLKNKGHWAMLEHEVISVRLTVDRGVTHEVVRHRHTAYGQESTRYVNYNKKGMGFIDPEPHFKKSISISIWLAAMKRAEYYYNRLINLGESPEMARTVLPNSLASQLVVTTNLTEWLHIFRLRTSSAAHPQMREVMIPLQGEFQRLLPEIFGPPGQ